MHTLMRVCLYVCVSSTQQGVAGASAAGLSTGCRCLGSTVLRSTEVPESVVCEAEMCSELRRSLGTVVAFNLPSCFVPEGM